MDVKTAIEKRRAYRSLARVKITADVLNELVSAAQLAASCFNNQPWRFIFVYRPDMLNKMHEVLSTGNEWAQAASMIVVVVSKKEFDCVIRDRIYYQFDCGMATAHLILRATELGLVAHPIAGFSPRKTREILSIPNDLDVITLVIIGKHAASVSPVLSDKQVEAEKNRPVRLNKSQFVFHNGYNSNEK